MTNILIFVIVYLAYILVWLIVNLLAYFASIAFKKTKIFTGLTVITYIIIYILNFLIGIGMFWWAISLLLSGEFLWLIFMIFIGFSLINGLLSFLQYPFIFIPAYLSEKIENSNKEDDVVTGEVLDEKGRVIAKSEGDSTISGRLAKYFLAFFVLNLLSIIIFPEAGQQLKAFDYITKPFLQMIGGSLIIGLPYIIYRKIKYRSFFPQDKRILFIAVWRLNLLIFGGIAILTVFLIWILQS